MYFINIYFKINKTFKILQRHGQQKKKEKKEDEIV